MKHRHCWSGQGAAGIGLKPEHFRAIVETWPQVGFFEIHAENYLVPGGPFHHYLGLIRERYPLSIHGVGLSIGGAGPLDGAHLSALCDLLERYQPAVFSEHLAWSTHDGVWFSDLLPVAYDLGSLNKVCEHIDQVQTALGRTMLLENPATYIEFAASTYSEPDFISEIVRRTGCGLLLDVNNLYLSCINHRRDLNRTLDGLPLHAVGEVHLAGFSRDLDAAGSPLLIDSHGAPVADAVWSLYATVIERIGPKPTLIEWDTDIPKLDVLLSEAEQANRIQRESVQGAVA